MPKILVLDAQMRNSLAIIRSLGKKGLEVVAGEETRFATSFFSKYCSNHVIYPSPTKRTEDFVAYMLNLVENDHYDFIFPVTDATVIPIVKYKKEFSKHTIVPYSDYTTLIKAVDKKTTLNIAMNCGIPHPKTYDIDDMVDLDDVDYPVILKPRTGFGSRGVMLCKSKKELVNNYELVSEKYCSPLVQEYIPCGGEVGVYTLFDFDSEPVAFTVQQRIRSYPVSGGPSTLRETIRNDDLVQMSVQLLKAMNWHGLAMVEFRIDQRNGEPKLMEINPRFWGSLQLSILAGADFPYLLYLLMKNGSVDPVLNYNVGVKCRWLLPGDILWFLSTPNKIRNLREFIRLDIEDDIISLEDPGPVFGFTLAVMRYLFDLNMWKFVLRR